MSYLKKRVAAFRFAFAGLRAAFKNEPHVKLHGVIALIVINAGFWFTISPIEWLAVLGCITLVISLELINSAIEKLCNLVMPDQHSSVKYIKDVSAAAVLVASLFAIVVALLVFVPYLKAWFN